MQNTLPSASSLPARWPSLFLGSSSLLLFGLLCLPEGGALWESWRSDAALSHGPLVPLAACGLLWMRRDRLREWKSADKTGLLCLALTCLVYIAAVWADVDFLKPLALIGAALCGVWFLGGKATLKACVGPLGFLVFMIPWPTVLMDRVAFPMQLTSSAYAGMLAGMAGVPVHREGVQLSVLPGLEAKPVYSIVVAQQCSGLTSMMVLLALGYLIACHTPLRWGWRAAILGFCIPLTVLMNAVRLAIILFAGAHHKPVLAQWIHNHEGPVLLFFCSLGMLGARHLLLRCLQPQTEEEGDRHVSGAPADSEQPLIADPAGQLSGPQGRERLDLSS
jgi:exosortase